MDHLILDQSELSIVFDNGPIIAKYWIMLQLPSFQPWSGLGPCSSSLQLPDAGVLGTAGLVWDPAAGDTRRVMVATIFRGT